MALDVNSVGDQFRSWATKCDANGDGRLDGDEISVFNQGKDNYQTGGTVTARDSATGKTTTLRQSDGVTVDGVQFPVNDIDKFQRNKDGKYKNTVRFKSGTSLDYNKQVGDKPGQASSHTTVNGTRTTVKGLNNPSGARVSGSDNADTVIFRDTTKPQYANNDGRDTVYY